MRLLISSAAPLPTTTSSLIQAEVLGGKKRVNAHPGWVIAEQRLEIGFHLLLHHAATREVRIDEVAEIEHSRIAPITAETLLHLFEARRGGAKMVSAMRRSLNIVYLIPMHPGDGKRLQIAGIYEGDHTQHLLVVFVLAEHLYIGLEEREVAIGNEFARELIDIHRLVVAVGVVVVERLLGDEVYDIVVIVDLDHCSVHPGVVLGDESHIAAFAVKGCIENGVLEYQVRLEEEEYHPAPSGRGRARG